jgi:hypothetical protein
VTWRYSRVGKTRAGYPFCHKSIDDLVDEMAPQIATLRQYFPDIQFGLVDSINSRWPDLPRGILSLIDTMDRVLHVKIGFVHTDVAWEAIGGQPWRSWHRASAHAACGSASSATAR